MYGGVLQGLLGHSIEDLPVHIHGVAIIWLGENEGIALAPARRIVTEKWTQDSRLRRDVAGLRRQSGSDIVHQSYVRSRVNLCRRLHISIIIAGSKSNRGEELTIRAR